MPMCSAARPSRGTTSSARAGRPPRAKAAMASAPGRGTPTQATATTASAERGVYGEPGHGGQERRGRQDRRPRVGDAQRHPPRTPRQDDGEPLGHRERGTRRDVDRRVSVEESRHRTRASRATRAGARPKAPRSRATRPTFRPDGTCLGARPSCPAFARSSAGNVQRDAHRRHDRSQRHPRHRALGDPQADLRRVQGGQPHRLGRLADLLRGPGALPGAARPRRPSSASSASTRRPPTRSSTSPARSRAATALGRPAATPSTASSRTGAAPARCSASASPAPCGRRRATSAPSCARRTSIYEIDEGRPIWKLRPLRSPSRSSWSSSMRARAVALVVSGPLADRSGEALGIGQRRSTV